MNRRGNGIAALARDSTFFRIGRRIAGFLGATSPTVHAAVFPADSSLFPKRLEVMVVDDNPDYQMALRDLLVNRGITPTLAADGAEAVALAGSIQFDIILMDLQMPVLDGLAASKQIRRFELEHDRPRVPMVAYTSGQTAEPLLRACGLDAVLHKPCSAMALEACLARWCPT